jgi:hypothetical protein
MQRPLIDRRTFLMAGALSTAGSSSSVTVALPKAWRLTIMIWLGGGASHIDTWDMKPDAPVESNT